MEEDIKLTKLAECAGCGAKVGAGQLAELLSGLSVHTDPNLLVGFDKSDDAAVYKVSDNLAIVFTTDFFPPIADDPYTFGAIAATNALSDIYAMGGEPKIALNVMAVPEDMPKEAVHEILRGGYEKVYEADALIVGGHSIFDPEPKYGLAVLGFVDPKKMYTNSGARPGDVLVYTKPSGIGVMVTAAKGGLAEAADVSSCESIMQTLNRYARDVMVSFDVHAVTDITGFGMLGHLLEMAQGADVDIQLYPEAVTFLPHVLEWAELGILPSGLYRNRHFAENEVAAGDAPMAVQDALFCPETSGGLMIAVAPDDAEALVSALRADGRVPAADIVGTVGPHLGGPRITLEKGRPWR
ncbi:MAG: selenide, water dikinase SelD [Atopobiaceae bacterium]